MAETSGSVRRVVAGICLALPYLGLLWPPLYAHERPELAGVPFFYWYLFAWVLGGIALMIAADWLLRGTRPPRDRPHR